jgi:hypothetical protein
LLSASNGADRVLARLELAFNGSPAAMAKRKSESGSPDERWDQR